MYYYNSAKENANRLTKKFQGKSIKVNNSTKKFHKILVYLNLFKILCLVFFVLLTLKRV